MDRGRAALQADRQMFARQGDSSKALYARGQSDVSACGGRKTDPFATVSYAQHSIAWSSCMSEPLSSTAPIKYNRLIRFNRRSLKDGSLSTRWGRHNSRQRKTESIPHLDGRSRQQKRPAVFSPMIVANSFCARTLQSFPLHSLCVGRQAERHARETADFPNLLSRVP